LGKNKFTSLTFFEAMTRPAVYKWKTVLFLIKLCIKMITFLIKKNIPERLLFYLLNNSERISMGRGKIIVEFFSAAISVNVPK
jgi:hypothetical protein